MYLKEIHISNIRTVRKLSMTFPEPAGWHVILGDNGAGKTSIIRAVAAALVGPENILRLDPEFGSWVTMGEKKAGITIMVEKHDEDRVEKSGNTPASTNQIECRTVIEQASENGKEWKFYHNPEKDKPGKRKPKPERYNWGNGAGWFSASFGPYRRFNGGSQSLESFYLRNPKTSAHLTAFRDDAALTESVVWLKDVDHRYRVKASEDAGKIRRGVIHFINQEDLLPEGYRLKDILPDGPIFETPTGVEIQLYNLSEGIKSVASLAFELLRLLLVVYPVDAVFSNFLDDDPSTNHVPVRGVVLIDEIDTHLHPTWQARIGFWFLRCFPNMQFIVTTHSPIICRPAAKGTIWRFPAPETGLEPYLITGQERNDLIYGDILDAFGTDLFGPNLTRSKAGHEKMERLAYLNMLDLVGQASVKEKKERTQLSKLFPNHVETAF